MKTVKEISKITGISIRTLRYYDEIGLLKPTKLSDAGYRLYDTSALGKLQEILFFKELDIPLTTIKSMLDNPTLDRQQILSIQKSLLERKRNRLNGIIAQINDVIEGVNTMNFEVFNDEDINKIINHSLELQDKETRDLIIKEFGSLESFKSSTKKSLENPERSAELIKIYGSKDKAINASLSSTGNRDEVTVFQEETDAIYHQFAYAMETNDDILTVQCVEQLSDSYKKMFRLDNAQNLLLKVAEDYLNNGLLNEATDKQYGTGVTEYIGKAIQKYFGV